MVVHTLPEWGKLKAIVRMATTVTVMGCSVGAGTVCWGQIGADPAKSYPSRPIRLIASFTPGTATDLAARVIAQQLTEAWGHQVIVDNRPGAGGRIGSEMGAKATPDGYTLTMATSGPMSVAPTLYPKLAYDVMRDFAPITNLVTQAQVLLASPAISVKTVAQAVELARSRPGAVNYASIGAGTLTHLTMELLQSVANIKLTHIPFKGSPAAHVELIGGQVQLMVDSLPAALSMIRAGKLRGIAVTSLERQKFAPELPTIAESGYPGFEAIGWAGVLAPAKTPRPILDKLNRELVRIISLSDTRERFEALGFNPAPVMRAEYTEFIRSKINIWRRVVKDAGIKLDN